MCLQHEGVSPSHNLAHERESLMSSAFAFNKWPRALRATSAVSVAVSAAILLYGCGGEGEGGISANSGAEVLLKAGEAGVVSGTLESVKYRLTNMSWSVMPLSATNPVLSVFNQDCAAALKNDSITPTLGTATSPAGSGGSEWQCKLTVFAEGQSMPTDALYQLTLSGLNEVGRQVGYTRQLRVQPNVALNGITPEGTYLKGMSVSPVASICQPGAPVRLTARGLPTDTVFNYRWRVVQGPLAVLAGAQTAEVGLIAPVVTASTVVVLQLEASALPITAENPAVYMARAVVHVDPTYPFESCGFQANF
jgi:hypothetical protein